MEETSFLHSKREESSVHGFGHIHLPHKGEFLHLIKQRYLTLVCIALQNDLMSD